jgi:hypothetical protein
LGGGYDERSAVSIVGVIACQKFVSDVDKTLAATQLMSGWERLLRDLTREETPSKLVSNITGGLASASKLVTDTVKALNDDFSTTTISTGISNINIALLSLKTGFAGLNAAANNSCGYCAVVLVRPHSFAWLTPQNRIDASITQLSAVVLTAFNVGINVTTIDAQFSNANSRLTVRAVKGSLTAAERRQRLHSHLRRHRALNFKHARRVRGGQSDAVCARPALI